MYNVALLLHVTLSQQIGNLRKKMLFHVNASTKKSAIERLKGKGGAGYVVFFDPTRKRLTVTKRAKPKKKTIIPENSCKNPCATTAPYLEARIAVKVSREILAMIAIGIAEKKRINFFQFGMDDIIARAAPSANMVTSERRPEQAATTSRMVSER